MKISREQAEVMVTNGATIQCDIELDEERLPMLINSITQW